jgi:hypothetical protein
LTPPAYSAYLSASCGHPLLLLSAGVLMTRLLVLRAAHFFLMAIGALPAVADESQAGKTTSAGTQATQPFAWSADYHAALDEAQVQRKLVLLWFFDPQTPVSNDRFETEILREGNASEFVGQHFVAVKLPLAARVPSAGQELALLEHPVFLELRHSPGLAIIDMTDEASPLFRQVVSVYPFMQGAISAEKLAVLLDLPRGTLTQRTLIFAVRTHPEEPASTLGHFSQILTRETENHAWHQASIGLQGHHNWDSRFHAINAQLPGGLAAREVCAESWPGQSLVEAAEECVHSWRQSSGHWDAVRSRHVLFAYDMKRSSNGIWYATGIFAGR